MELCLKAADKGDTNAMDNLEHIVRQDYQKAMQWFLKAANEGNSVAMNSIGTLYNQGFGVE